jgi:signal peptidase I
LFGSLGKVVVAKSKQTAESDAKTKGAPGDEAQEETTIEFLASLASVLVTGLFIITFVLQAFEIPSGSMENTLLIGDHVFVNREQFAPPSSTLGKLLPYRTPHNDEVAVFVHPAQPGIFLVKRIIGIPGDRLRVREGVVYRNGEMLKEPYTKHKPLEERVLYADNFPSVPPDGYATPEWGATQAQFIQGGEVVVPPGHFFAMGDNRDNSNDSRYWGFLPQENLIGRPMFIYWSFETPEGQWEHRAFVDRIGFLLHTVIHFFDETRWRRTFKVVG